MLCFVSAECFFYVSISVVVCLSSSLDGNDWT